MVEATLPYVVLDDGNLGKQSFARVHRHEFHAAAMAAAGAASTMSRASDTAFRPEAFAA